MSEFSHTILIVFVIGHIHTKCTVYDICDWC